MRHAALRCGSCGIDHAVPYRTQITGRTSMSTRQPCMALRPTRQPLPACVSVCFCVTGFSRKDPIVLLSAGFAAPPLLKRAGQRRNKRRVLPVRTRCFAGHSKGAGRHCTHRPRPSRREPAWRCPPATPREPGGSGPAKTPQAGGLTVMARAATKAGACLLRAHEAGRSVVVLQLQLRCRLPRCAPLRPSWGATASGQPLGCADANICSTASRATPRACMCVVSGAYCWG
jgi:hypothetical protein